MDHFREKNAQNPKPPAHLFTPRILFPVATAPHRSTMPLQDDIAALIKQESTLTLPGFTPDIAWQIGVTLI